MDFCPSCGNLLLVEHAALGRSLRFFCPTCPYVFPIERKVWLYNDLNFEVHLWTWSAWRNDFAFVDEQQITNKLQLSKKEVDDVLGGEEAWKNVDRTEGKALLCYHFLLACFPSKFLWLWSYLFFWFWSYLPEMYLPPSLFHANSNKISWRANVNVL